MDRELVKATARTARKRLPPAVPPVSGARSRTDAILALQRATGNAVVTRLVRGSAQRGPVVQRMGWSWYGGAWHADDPATTNPPPARAGRQGEYFDDAAVAPPVLAGPPRLVYDTHGDKHFTGKDSQWANGRNSVNGMLEAEILRRLAALRTHAAAGTPGAGGFVGFYYTKNEGEYVGNLGYKKGPKTNYYTIQIEVNVQKNEINYHGYPDTNAYVGLGYTAMARGLAL